MYAPATERLDCGLIAAAIVCERPHRRSAVARRQCASRMSHVSKHQDAA